MKAIVSEKGQVTIPKKLRDRMGIAPGQILDIEEERGKLVVRKTLPAEDSIDAVWGILAGEFDTDEFIEELRGPAPSPEELGKQRPRWRAG